MSGTLAASLTSTTTTSFVGDRRLFGHCTVSVGRVRMHARSFAYDLQLYRGLDLDFVVGSVGDLHPLSISQCPHFQTKSLLAGILYMQSLAVSQGCLVLSCVYV